MMPGLEKPGKPVQDRGTVRGGHTEAQSEADLLFLWAYMTDIAEVEKKCQGTMPAKKKDGVKREEKRQMK